MLRLLSLLLEVLVYTAPGLLLFVGLFWLDVAHSSIPVLMYRGLFLAVIALCAHLLALIPFLAKHRSRDYLILSAISLAFAANTTFLIVFPVTIDRSVSVYLLGQLLTHPSGMTENELSQRLIREYVTEYRGVDRRMQEQMLTGNVKVTEGRYTLTEQGKLFMHFSGLVSNLFSVDPRFVRPLNDGPYQDNELK